ncbi:hypothetical protein ROSEINA2194_03885-like protein [Organic Lake phycodnavirus]|jgi:hypothetical protein|nr:hypothetical protein ROSEINA2194_03885-like protein [Organic Lake phycodnavirus]
MEIIHSKDYSYNKNLYVRESHNCYNYFLNLKNRRSYNICKEEYKQGDLCDRAQPGYAAKLPLMKSKDYNCKTMMKRTLLDNKNVFQTTRKKKCPKSHYKGALAVAPGEDFHYYRYNDDGIWTHKPGYKPSTNVDANNSPIDDPETASRRYPKLNYSDFCGYLCVPRSRRKKTMKMYKEK